MAKARLTKELLEFAISPDPDATLIKHIGATALAAADNQKRWAPGQPLELLLAGYFGAGNVGSDMRAHEIVRQLCHLLGEDQVTFAALTLTDEWPRDVLGGVAHLPFDDYPPNVLASAVAGHHGVVACEGSMFKSKFSNVLSAFMAGTLGLAARADKLSVGYGAEVAAMDEDLSRFVSEQAAGALIICRNDASFRTAEAISLRALPGADTAWTFAAAPRDRACALLGDLGWNGEDKILTVCASNPFWWPVRANPAMALEMQKTGRHADLFYGSVFFHAHNDEIEGKYRHYIDQLGSAVNTLCHRLDAFPLIVGMERVDARACRDLTEKVAGTPPIIMGYQHEVRDVVAVLRLSALLISSRFHAMVGAMPGCVRSIGVAMDERIKNLLHDASQSERIVLPDDEQLAAKIVGIASELDADHVAAASRKTVADAVTAIGHMGVSFLHELSRIHPEFPVAVSARSWQACLPALPDDIAVLIN